MVDKNMAANYVLHIRPEKGKYFEPGFTRGYIELAFSDGIDRLTAINKKTNNPITMRIGRKLPAKKILEYIIISREPKSTQKGRFILLNFEFDDENNKKFLNAKCYETVSFPVSLECDADRNTKIGEKEDEEKKANWIWGKDGRGDILMVNNMVNNNQKDDPETPSSPKDDSKESKSPKELGYTELRVKPTGYTKLPHNLKLCLYATPRASQRFAVYRVIKEEKSEKEKLELILGNKKTDKKKTEIIYPDSDCIMKQFIEISKCLLKKLFRFKPDVYHNLYKGLNPAGETLWVEAHEYPGPYFEGLITVELQLRQEADDKQDQILASDRVLYRIAPWIMTPNAMKKEDVEKVYVCEITDGDYPNGPFIKKLDRILKIIFKDNPELFEGKDPFLVNIPPGKNKKDRWIQDQIEIGYSGNINHKEHVVFNSPRHQGLFDLFKKQDQAKITGISKVFQLGGTKTNSLDSFGNLEVSPPIPKRDDKKNYPLGRVIFGGIDYGNFSGKYFRQMMPEIRRFLYAQKVQSPIEIYTDWLDVGHVDEIICFIPSPTPLGFKVLLASPKVAIDILTTLQKNDHGEKKMFEKKPSEKNPSAEISVNDLLKKHKFREVNEKVYQGYMNRNRKILKDGLGLEDNDFIPIPVLFDVKHNSRGVPQRTSAYFPNMVNHLVIGYNHIVPKPFGPKLDEKERNCEFEKAFCSALKENSQDHKIWFIDDWIPYFRNLGGVHCATNTRRKIPETKWWEEKPDGGFDI